MELPEKTKEEQEEETTTTVTKKITRKKKPKQTEVVEVVQEETKKVRRKSKEEIEEEIEVIEVESGERIRKKKKLISYKPYSDEEVYDEEKLGSVKPFEFQKESQMPLETSTTVMETVPTNLVSSIVIGEKVEGTSTVNILPHSALTREEVMTVEKEETGKDVKNATFVATKQIDTLETFQTTEQNVQSLPEEFQGSYQPTMASALSNVTPIESLTVKQVQPNEMFSDYKPKEVKGDQATFSVLTQEATFISQADVTQKETDMDEYQKPQTSTATSNYTTKESIQIEEVHEGQFEDDFEASKPTPIKPKFDLRQQESLIVEEVVSETKPGKHLPQAFVPTEVANKNIVPQKQLVQSEMVAPELEGEYTPGKLPPSQLANLNIVPGESIITEQMLTHDKETEFTGAPQPEITKADTDLVLSESVTVTAVDSQMPQGDMDHKETDKQTAEVEILEKESVIVSSVVPNENENVFDKDVPLDAKQADTTITCLETSGISDVILQESEGAFFPDKAPTKATAEATIKPVEHLGMSEVQTADLPDEFADKFKFKTDEATTRIDTFESQQVLEVQSAEREKDYQSSDQVKQTADSSYTDTQQEVGVTIQERMDSEKLLAPFEIPESYKGKSTPTGALPTSITQEVNVESVTKELVQPKKEDSRADVKQDTNEETVITEAVVSESTKTYTPGDKPEDRFADVSIKETQSVNVLEVNTVLKEGIYKAEELPSEIQAIPDIEGQVIASKAEVTASELPSDLAILKPNDFQATTDQTTLESVQITQYLPGEKEKDDVVTIVPDKQAAALHITEANEEISVSEVLTNEKENELKPDEKPTAILATTNVAKSKAPVQSLVEAVVHADELPEDEPITGRAKKYAKPLQELIVTESVATDIEKTLEEDVFPNKKTAGVDVIPGQELSVTEVVTDDKEGIFKPGETPESRQAVSDILYNEVAVKQEVVSDSTVGKFDKTSPEKELAKPTQDVTHHIVETEHTVGEKEGEHASAAKPDEKRVHVEFEEGQHVTTTQTDVSEKETPFDKDKLPEGQVGTVDLTTHGVAVAAVVQSEDSTKSFTDTPVEGVKADEEHLLFTSLTQTQPQASENEVAFTDAAPDFKTATSDLIIGESIDVTSVTLADKEKPFAEQDKPETKTAETEITSIPTALNEEVVCSETLDSYDAQKLNEQTASLTQTSLESVVRTEAQAGESETQLAPDQMPETQKGHVELEGQMLPSVTLVAPTEKEGLYDEAAQPDLKQAVPQMTDSQQATLISEVVTDVSLGQSAPDDVKREQATVEQTTQESIVQTQSEIRDSERPLEESKPDAKEATVDFVEGQSVSILEVTSGESELPYKTGQTPDSQQAVPDVTAHTVLEQTEVTSNDAFGNLTTEQPQEASAQPDITSLTSAVNFEPVVTETEDTFSKDSVPESKRADVNIDEEHSLSVQTVTVEEKETPTKPEDKPEGKTAKIDFMDINPVASNLEVVPSFNTGTLDDQPNAEVTANVEAIPLEASMQSQTVAAEAENVFNEKEQPFSAQANVNLDTLRQITISEQVTGESAETMSKMVTPEQKSAQVDMNELHLVAEQQKVTSSEQTKHLDVTKPSEQTVETTQDTLTSLIITESRTEESEGQFTTTFKPETKNVDVRLEEGKIVQNVTETLAIDKEGAMDDLAMPEDKTAVPAIDSQEIASKTEVTANELPKAFSETPYDTSNANLNIVPIDSLVGYQPLVQESEDTLTLKDASVTKQASTVIDEIQSLVTSEVRITESEKKFETQQPEMSKATTDYDGSRVAQSAETLTLLEIDDMKTTKPAEATAEVTSDQLHSVQNTQPLVGDSETEFQDKFEPAQKKATVEVEEHKSLTISEVLTSGVEEELETPTKQLFTAAKSFDVSETIEESHVVLQEGTTEMSIDDKPTQTVNVEQDALTHVVQTESIVNERETDLEKPEDAPKKLAEMTIDEVQSVNISEVLTDEKENEFITEKESAKTASSDFIQIETLQQTVTVAQDSTRTLARKSPGKESAELTQSNLESIVTTESLVQENEAPFTEQPVEGKQAELSILPQTTVDVEETLTVDKELTFTEKQPTTAQADKTIIPQDATLTTEALTSENIDVLAQKEPNFAQATPEHLPHETVNVSQSFPAEKESALVLEDIKNTYEAEIDMEKPKVSADVFQVTTDEKEETFVEQITTKHTANLTLLENISTEQEQTLTLQTIEQLPQDDEKPTYKATKTQTTVQNITQTEIVTNEQESEFNVTTEAPQSAKVDLLFNEGLTVTEINTEELEGEEVFTRKASDKVAKPELIEKHIAVKEETTILQLPEEFTSNVPRPTTTSQQDFVYQHGIVVSEQMTTGNLESVIPEMEKPTKKAVSVTIKDKVTGLEITEIQVHDKEGK